MTDLPSQAQTLAHELVDSYHRNRLGKPHCSTIEVKIANHLSADILSQAIGILENIGWRIEKAAVQDPGARESSYFIHRRPPQTLVN